MTARTSRRLRRTPSTARASIARATVCATLCATVCVAMFRHATARAADAVNGPAPAAATDGKPAGKDVAPPNALPPGAIPPGAPPPEVAPPAPPGSPAVGKKPAGKDASAAVLDDAVAKLTTEYKAARAKRPPGALREKSDYFATVPPGLTPEKVIAAVSKPVASDPVLDAYVRWQLLSALGTDVDPKLSPKLLSAYRTAPRPLARFGSGADERRELDRLIRGRDLDVDAVNTQFAARVDQRAAQNAPVYAFRNDLFARLPPGPDAFVAALSDAADRFRAADTASAGAVMKELTARATLWSVSVDNPRARIPVLEAVEALRKQPGVDYYAELEAKGTQRRWKLATAKPSVRQLDDVRDALASGTAFDDRAAKGKPRKDR